MVITTSWRTTLILWLVLSALGIVMIALPDSGPRLATFSEAHGPGLVDAIGIGILLIGNGLLWWYLWRARALVGSAATRVRALWTFAAGLGTGLLLASVASDFSAWWAVGAGLLTIVQVTMFALSRQPYPQSGTGAAGPRR